MIKRTHTHTKVFPMRALLLKPVSKSLRAVCLSTALLSLRAHAQTGPGTALRFDGTANYMTIAGPPAALQPPWTAEFWVNRQDALDYAATLLGDASTALRLE